MNFKKISILSLVLALLLCGCGTKLNESLNINDAIVPEAAENNIASAEYETVSENDKLIFSMNKDTTAFKLTDKANGYEWYSTAAPTQSNTEADAPFSIAFVNNTGLIETMDAMTDSIALGQYSIEKLSDGAKVTYSLGEYNVKLNIPYAFNEERKKELLGMFSDDFKANQFDIMYQKIVFDRLDEKNQKKFLSQYPTIDKEPLYVLRDSISGSEDKMRELARLLSEIGYTDEMYEEDKNNFVLAAEDENEAVPQFRIQLVYTLTESGLRVTVPESEIQMNAEFPIVEIELLRYFGSPKGEDEGYFLLPDGSGSIMNFYNGRGDLQNYSVAIYGNDKAAPLNENIYSNEQAYLPLWGIKNSNNAVLATIDEGAAIAVLNAYPGGDRLSPYAAATFRLRSYYRSYTSQSNDASNYFVSIENERYKGDIVLDYTLLSGDDADYMGMAKLYRKRLFGNSDSSTVSSGAVIELMGLIENKAGFAGFTYNKETVLTDIKSVGSIAEELSAAGINNLKVKYSGWSNGGWRNGFANRVELNKKLGTEAELMALNEKLSAMGVGFYPDTELQYTYKDKSFDGFSSSEDVSTLISKAKGYLIEYNPATFMRDPEYKAPAYINNPSAISRAFEGFFKDYNRLGIDGISIRSIGRDLNADYSDTEGVGRETALRMLKESMSGISDKKVMVSGSNAWVLTFADYICDIPLGSAAFDNTDMAVPFLQAVVSGKIGYSGPALNLEGNVKEAVLQMAAFGADPYYMLSAENGKEVIEGDYSFLYSSDYGYLKEDIISTVTDYQEKMSEVIGKRIVGYEKLSDRLFKTTFENRQSVVVNYSEKEIEADGTVYAPKSYTVEKEGM